MSVQQLGHLASVYCEFTEQHIYPFIVFLGPTLLIFLKRTNFP